MEYVIPIVLVVLLVGGLVTFLALNATKKSGSAAADDDAPGIGRDKTPLGDTTQHAGEQSEGGVTTSDPESGAGARSDPDAAAHVGRPGEARAKPQPVTSEARQGEGAERLGFEGAQPRGEDPEARAERLRREQAQPASERLADRDA